VRRLNSVARGAAPLVHAVAEMVRESCPELPLSNADARRIVIAGAARVNGRVVTRPAASLAPGDRLTVSVDASRLARRRRAQERAVQVLYQDDHIVAVNKPPDVPTHATADSARPHLVGEVARQLGVNASAIGVHQRLDAGTSGVVLFALTPEANRGMAKSFADREVEKTYLAIADGQLRPDVVPGTAWVVRGTIAATGSGRRGRRMIVGAAGQASETAFAALERRGDRVLLEARPKTGRQHQIRAHLAAERMPILGDGRYGGPPAERLHLHAWRLRLPHPVTGELLLLEGPAPEGWLSRP
jgi:23S rRNA pseudouridine1911/1915/1917 synthase